MRGRLSGFGISLLAILSPVALLAVTAPAEASTAYGTLNNFDCVNDTGHEAHGFEIELEDVHSRDITYTYDYNHYGIPKITEDNTDPLHPRVTIRYAATRNPDGTWSAYTAIPSGPINPTDGHQFTNPSVNFGGEHFGAGYYGAPTAVRYFWLIDDGIGNLVHGPPVMVATPTFTYYAPAPFQPAQVQAVIVPPPPPAPPVFRFGEATWVKDIKTKTHNAGKVELRDLVDPDPDDPMAPDWRNGEPDEVETEWRMLQTEFANAGNPKGELAGQPEDLPDGDEVITRRYEFYKYIGPIDAESGEAVGDEVGPDGIHGVGSVTYNDHIDPMTGEWVEVTIDDLSTVEVVGEFFGAQMSGFDVVQALGLIDHIPDGELGVAYAERTVVVAGGAAFLALTSGLLPDGTMLDPVTGIFSGTPTSAGVFTFTVDASDTSGAFVSKAYTVTIMANVLPPDCITDADCADVDACTSDVCVGGICEHQPIAVCCNADEECIDGDACTEDLCVNHVCTHGPVPGCCSTDAECVDADACTRDLCVNHVCTHDPIPACCNTDAECADAEACTTDVCVGNVCEHQSIPGCCNTTAECADTNDCTFDACVNHLCEHAAVAGCCLSDGDCTDGDACTADACVNHVCEHTAVAGCCRTAADCDDGNPCTRDTCQANVCVRDPIVDCCTADLQCADSDPCTLDSCNAAANQCVHQRILGCCVADAECVDTDACTIDTCVNQLCTHNRNPGCCTMDADCDDDDDDDDCTTDRCENGVCVHESVSDCCREDGDCEDENTCTTDRCVGSVCQHADVPDCCNRNAECDDGIACTRDRCTDHVCRHTPRNSLCSDRKPCNGEEVCDPTVGCLPGIPVDCDDGIACTVDKCNERSGVCQHTPDHSVCGDAISCTRDRCVPSVGCVHKPDDSRCDDGLFCNGEERCNLVSGCRPADEQPCPGKLCDESRNRCRPYPEP